jgi:glycosyltransferase involved in cell wall biosynthesis
MNEPLSSIIICNYNYAEFLGACIDSALAQSYKNVEVIVVDDGSTDNSLQVIASFGDRITAISQRNGGQASAFNAGGRAAHGEIVSLLDSDDLFYPDKVARVVDAFVADPAIDWCFHSLYMSPPTGVTDPYLAAHGGLPSGFNDMRTMVSRGRFPYLMPPTSGMSFRRRLLDRLLPMPEYIRITADNYLKMSAAALATGWFLPANLALQRIHGNNLYTLKRDRALIGVVDAWTALALIQTVPCAGRLARRLLSRALACSWRHGLVATKGGQQLGEALRAISLPQRIEVTGTAILRAALGRY